MTEQELVGAVWDLLNDASRLLISYAPKSAIADALYKDTERIRDKADEWLGENPEPFFTEEDLAVGRQAIAELEEL